MTSTGWLTASILLATVTAAAVAYVSYDRDIPMSSGLTVTAIGVTVTLVTRLVVVFTGYSPVHDAVRVLAGSLIILGWVYLIAHYTDNEWAVERHRIFVLAIPMALTSVVYWVEAIDTVTGGDGAVLVQDLGPWDAGFALYSYLLTFLTIVALAVRFFDERPIYRRRAAILAIAPLPPALIAATYLVGVNSLDVDLTPVGYAMTTTIALYALNKHDLLEIVPLARETTVNNIEDGVIAVTDAGVIASVNDPGKEMLSVTDSVVGRDLADGLSGWPSIVEAVTGGDEEQVQIGDAHVKVLVTPIEKQGVRLGAVVQLKDITREVERRQELRAKQRALERKNEQLDEFASVVSHDIRNPLTVAKGHLELIAEEIDQNESVERIADAHDRIEAITRDLLTLAQQGRRVSETTTVDFVTLARRARDTTAVPTDGFECLGPRTLEADPSRLQQLLENLFRNNVDHGGENVAVTVGPLEAEEGFFVEDDGPGIPERERHRVFEYGYTNSDDGTGLGLSIVESIAEAHGWDVRVVDGTDGGARFEFVTGDPEDPESGASDTSEAATI